MSSGKHRRPEPDPLPDVDLAERLSPGPVVRAESEQLATPAARAVPTDPVSGTTAGSAAAAPGPTVVVRRDRRTERTARRRARRRRVLVIGAGVLGVGLVVLGAWLLLRPSGTETPTTSTTADKQKTTLVQLTGTDGTAAASAIVGSTKGDGSAVALLVPSRLNVDVAGSGAMAFGETTTIGDPEAPSASLTDLLGLRVDDTWTLTKPALAALVDAVGGVQAAVDVDVVDTAPNGAETVVVKAGNQLLKGSEAAAYASYLADGEPEEARLARFDDVLTALLAKLPADETGIGAFLATAGGGSSSNLDQAALAARLAVMRQAAKSGDFVSDVLPVNEIDTGGPVPSYGLNVGDAEAALREKFPGSLQQDAAGGVVRVLVENGVGTPGLVEQARSKLVDAGFQFKNGGNASPFTDQPSSVQVSDGTDESLAEGRRVAAALGLPADSVVPNDRGQTIADVIVILGPDFAP
jgi:hypothetical protein